MTQTLEAYSFSKIQCFARCPKKYQYQYIQKLYTTRKAPPLSLGGCMAEGVGCFRKTGSLKEAQLAFIDQWEKDGKILAIRSEDDEMRSVERGLEILEAYTKYYPEEGDGSIKPEIVFEEEIFDFIFRGRIDGVDADSQGIAIVEDKTVSRLGPSYFVELLSGWQVCWYMGIAKHLGLFNTIRKNQMPRCIANAIYIHPNKFRFEREITMKGNKTLEHAMEELRNWVGVIRIATDANTFPMADSEQCRKYGGCDYLRLCAATEESVQENIIKVDFEYRLKDHWEEKKKG